ncbi:MAG: hypothetical protein NTX03_02900 [Bacteroidetes bacterium]|nr:hypothetical protein [Bacteroidota bacterium]
MRKFLLFLFILISGLAIAQNSDEKPFLSHLVQNKFYDEGILAGKSALTLPLSKADRDSIRYMIGICHYFNKQFDSSIMYCASITQSGELYDKAHTLASFQNIYQRKPDEAISLINSSKTTDSIYKEFALVQYGVAMLLKKDYNRYDSVAKNFTYKNYALEKSEYSLNEKAAKLKGIKLKSPVLAGISSAIIPGLGKVYAGKPGQGIAILAMCATFGVQAWDGYRRHHDIRDPYFIAFGSMFGLFYVGNIVGSVYAAKNYNREKYEGLYSNIILDLHVPLRTLLNL